MVSPTVRVSGGEAEARDLLDGAWDQLVRAQARPNPTLLGGWLKAMLAQNKGEFVVVRVEHEDRLVAGAAVTLHRPLGRWGPILARWPADPELWFDPDILVEPGFAEAGSLVVQAIIERAHALYVPCIADSALASVLSRRDTGAGHIWPSILDGWITPIPIPRDAYMRRAIAKDTRKAQRKGGETEVRVAASSDEIEPALERLFDLHHSFWSSRRDQIQRFSATHELRTLNRAAVRALGENGESFVVEVFENGELVSASLGLLAGHGLVSHTTATHRNAIMKEPGYACQLAVIDYAASRGASIADLGPGAGGSGTVKGRVGAIRTPIHLVMCARTPALLRACSALVSARDGSRKLARLVGRRLPRGTPTARHHVARWRGGRAVEPGNT